MTYHYNDDGAMPQREKQSAGHWQLSHANKTSCCVVYRAVEDVKQDIRTRYRSDAIGQTWKS